MVGVPGTEERLALAEIEDRLRRVRSRINWYGLQRKLYIVGTVLALGASLLIFCAFTVSSLWFTLVSWPVLLLLAFVTIFFLRRVVTEWIDIAGTARSIDSKLGLKDRLSTLVAQLLAGVIGKPQPSPLWPHLLQENTTQLAEWTIKQVAPRRIPWHILPFFLAALLVLFMIAVPLMTSQSERAPFSPENLQRLLQELPERASLAVEKQMSLLPEPSDQWGKSSLYNQDPQQTSGEMRLEPAQPDGQPESRQQEALPLASLPEALQEKIRQALRGLPDKESPGKEPQNIGKEKRENRLALKPSDKAKNPEAVGEAKNLSPSSTEQMQTATRGQGNDKKNGKSGSGTAGDTQMPAQGSGIQQLGRAQLDRKSARGAFQPSPDSPQLPSSGGEAGEGGMGAGSGTDPRLYGEQTVLSNGAKSFQLSLETTHEKTHKGEETDDTDDKDTGGIIDKSTGALSQQQSLDDTIRKSRVPAEYEEIVKRVFARGESR